MKLVSRDLMLVKSLLSFLLILAVCLAPVPGDEGISSGGWGTVNLPNGIALRTEKGPPRLELTLPDYLEFALTNGYLVLDGGTLDAIKQSGVASFVILLVSPEGMALRIEIYFVGDANQMMVRVF
jgi:hypothetical protein